MQTSPLKELAFLFLKLGITGFGGPAAHIAMMEAEVVRKRQWMSRESFLDLLSATNLIPGPNSTEMALHIGYLRAGWKGLLIAGLCFIGPALFIVLSLAAIYKEFGQLPHAQGLLLGIKPVMIAIMAHALWSLSRPLTKKPKSLLLAALCAGAALAGWNEFAILFGGGAAALLSGQLPKRGVSPLVFLGLIVVALPLWALVSAELPAPTPFSETQLYWFFVKVGSVLYGSGYVLVAFLDGVLVKDWGWLTNRQLLDAISIGQITPGPVFTTATFIGYLLGDVRGALLSTAAIFAPAFVFVAASTPWIPKLRQSERLAHFLDGLNAASLGLMAAVVVQFAIALKSHPVLIGVGAISWLLLASNRLNSTVLMLAAAVFGWVWLS